MIGRYLLIIFKKIPMTDLISSNPTRASRYRWTFSLLC
jgi:hypothetical protein